jgi:hypothetical protein
MAALLLRWVLQEILADACERIAGPNVIENSSNVVAYEELRDPATGAGLRTSSLSGTPTVCLLCWVHLQYRC